MCKFSEMLPSLITIYMCRRNFEMVLEAMAFNDSSSNSLSSSEEEDMDLLFCELAFRPKRELGTRLNLLDLSDLECEQLFR